MIQDQANELRQLVRRQARFESTDGPTPKLIAVTGAQRAAGSTTVALNLAVALATHGRRTILVDADLDRPVAATYCGIQAKATVVDILTTGKTIHEVLVRGPAGLQILPGAWAPSEAHDSSALAQTRFISQIKSLGTHADVIVIDTGCDRGSFVRRFWQAADTALIVTTPEPMSIVDCYASIKVLLAGSVSSTVKTLVNRAPSADRAGEIHGRIATACKRFLGLRIAAAGYLPDDPLIDDSARQQVPLVLSAPKHTATRTLECLADQLWHEQPTSASISDRGSISVA